MKSSSKDSENFGIRHLFLLSGLIVFLLIALPARNCSCDRGPGSLSLTEIGASLQGFLPAKQVILPDNNGFDQGHGFSNLKSCQRDQLSMISLQNRHLSEFKNFLKTGIELNPAMNRFIVVRKIPAPEQDDIPLIS